MGKMRIEHDFLGKKEVAREAYWGIHTQRAVENFPVSGLKSHPAFIRALVEIKLAAAIFFKQHWDRDRKLYAAVMQACREVLDGKFHDAFPVDVFQAGAGTSLNMNVNEVLANRANELLGGKKGVYAPVHPNDHVNNAQSTNDVFPTAMRIAAIRLGRELCTALDAASLSFRKKGDEFRALVKSGRTHLNDAMPVTLGSELTAYGIALKKDSAAIRECLKELHIVGIGGTAVGSGLNAPDLYKKDIVHSLSKVTGLLLKRDESLYEAMQDQSAFARLMGVVKACALDLTRICNDLRLMASGPRTGLNEIFLPEVQAGSSIMPGKINPTIPEMTTMTCFYVCGMEQTVAMAVQAGQFELNVMMPVIAHSTLSSLEYFKNAVNVLTEKCVRGIGSNKYILRKYAESSLGIAAILSPVIGYEKTAELVKEAKRENVFIIDLIRNRKILSEQKINSLLFDKSAK